MRSFLTSISFIMLMLFVRSRRATLINHTARLHNISNSSHCHPVSQYVECAFFLNVGQQRRGAETSLLFYFYNQSITRLMQIILTKSPLPGKIGDACLNDTDIETLYSLSYQPIELSLSQRTSSRKLESHYSLRNLQLSSHQGSTQDYFLNDSQVLNWTAPGGLDFIQKYNTSFVDDTYEVMGVMSAVGVFSHLPQDPRFHGEVFYLPRTQLEDAAIPDIPDDSQIYIVWEEIKNTLQLPPDLSLVSSITKLPKTIDVFYDPYEESVRNNYTQLVNTGQHITGIEFLYEVTRVVLNLHFSFVSNRKSLSLLNHAAAFLFNAMRSQRREGDDLVVSDLFLAIYQHRARILRNQWRTYSGIDVKKETVKEIYHDDLSPLLAFCNHGILDYAKLQTNGTFTKNHFESVLFDKAKLSEVVSKSGNRKDSNTEDFGWWWWWTSLQAFLQESSTRQQSGEECEPGFYCYELVTPPSDINCCASVCSNITEITAVGIMSESSCCNQCNYDACPMDNGEPIAALRQIMIEQYGWFDSDTETIVV